MESERQLEFTSLDDLEPRLRQDRMLGKMIGVHRMPTAVAAQLADVNVHSVERALRQYVSARLSLGAFLSGGTMTDYSDAQGTMEGSTLALHRANCCLDRLRRLGLRGTAGAPFIPRPRDLAVISSQATQRVREFRDSIEHVEADIASGCVDPSAVPLIHMGWKKATHIVHELEYSEVAAWIRSHYEFASKLSAFQIKVGPAPVNDGATSRHKTGAAADKRTSDARCARISLNRLQRNLALSGQMQDG